MTFLRPYYVYFMFSLSAPLIFMLDIWIFRLKCVDFSLLQLFKCYISQHDRKCGKKYGNVVKKHISQLTHVDVNDLVVCGVRALFTHERYRLASSRKHVTYLVSIWAHVYLYVYIKPRNKRKKNTTTISTATRTFITKYLKWKMKNKW